jgi:hypothetical protein
MLSVDRTKPRQYGDDKGRYWSVSQVVEAVIGDKGFMDPIALQRGTDVHQIFALRLGASMDWCDMPDVPEEYQGYDAAIVKWIEQAKPEPKMLERMLRHKLYPYAGQVDFVGLVGPDYGVLDLKTGQPQKWHSLQVHGYQKMLDKAARMWILYVGADGNFKQVAVKPSARDWAVFQNGLSILQWRESA